MERKEKMEISFTFEELLQQVNAAPILRKVKTYLDNPNISAGMNALFIAAIISITTATSAFAGSVTQKQIETDFSKNSTEAQRDFAWADYEGESVSITGIIYDVDVPSWLLKEYRVHLDIANGIDVFCSIPEAQKNRVKALRAGQTFTCKGTLSSYSFIFGSAGISVDSDGRSVPKPKDYSKIDAAIKLLESEGYKIILK
jgi:hypothetical protein